MKTARVSVLVVALAGAACATRTPIVTVPYQPGGSADGPTSGLVYFTPQTLLRVEVTYTVTSTKGDRVFRGARIRKPVVVTPEVHPDPGNRFLIRAAGASSSAFSESSISVKLTDSGLLAAVDAEVTDKSLEAARAVVGAGLSAARLLAVAGLAARGAEETVDEDVKYSVLLDPAMFVAKAGGYYEQEIVPVGLVANVNEALLPHAVVRLFASPAIFARAGAYRWRGEVRGIVHRRPEPLYVEVRVPSGEALLLAAAQIVSFDQFGEFLSVPVTGKTWSGRRTTVKLGASGGVTEVAVESKASASESAKALAGAADDVRGALDDLRFNLKTAQLEAAKKLEEAQAENEDAARLAELKQQKALADAEAALLKARKELEAARATPRATPTPKARARPTPRA
jgi:hypothetical protein